MRRFIFAVIILLIFSSANFELWSNYRNKPAGTTYQGATGFYFDYYQFLSWMRDGSRGNILISSRYIPELEKPALLHPFFPVLGFLSQAVGLSLPITYHLARNVFLGLYLFSLYLLSKAVFKQVKYQRWSYLSILAATAFPYIGILNGQIFLAPMIDFWQTFYTLEKFNIPAHHLLAKSLFVLLTVLIIKKSDDQNSHGNSHPEFISGPKGMLKQVQHDKRYVIILVSILLVLVNPASMTFMLMMLVVVLMVMLIPPRGVFLIFLIVFLSVLPFMLYNWQIFNYGNPWQYYYLGEKVGRYSVPFRYYLGSLGPFFLTSLLSLVYFRKMRVGEKLMVLWNFLPVLMFPFVGRQIPFSMSRLFSVDTFIPSSILTVFFFRNFQPRINTGRLFKRSLLMLLLIATILGGYYSVGHVFNYKLVDYYNVFLPQNLVGGVDYINNNTRRHSTILAGENISNLLPAITDNHVIWGRRDAYGDYKGVEKQINEIYLRLVPDDKIIERLRQWRVQYIIFGIDNVRYDDFVKKGVVTGLAKVFQRGDITVVEAE